MKTDNLMRWVPSLAHFPRRHREVRQLSKITQPALLPADPDCRAGLTAPSVWQPHTGLEGPGLAGAEKLGFC